MADKIVPLSRRYEVPGEEPFDSITLREPTYQDIVMDGLGYPQELQPNGHGGSMIVTYYSVVDAYAQRLIKAPQYGAVSRLSVEDTRTVEEAICGFFLTRAPKS
jgi:hypothetical protein